jgi:hypothetical protein
MNDTEKRDFYLSKAKEAEESAASAQDESTKATFLLIAEGFRSLATPHAALKSRPKVRPQS